MAADLSAYSHAMLCVIEFHQHFAHGL